MTNSTPRLRSLIQRLDALEGETTLAGIAQTLEEVTLTVDDVAGFLRPNPTSYHRARVVRRDHYELLVMTWLPGQASVPHDHTGSVCALQVLQGEAAESDYSIASDSYADLEYESLVSTGQVSAGQDAGIHSIRNPSKQTTLVTVHVYAPPLRDFRQFVPRPGPVAESTPQGQPTVVIVGGGFSGAMTAAQLLRHGSRLKVVLVERRGTVAEGLAYSTREPVHLLNVPAARMSAWPDKPDDFLHWAQRRDANVKPGDFLPRQWYSDYLREALHQAARHSDATLEVVLDDVRRVARHPAGRWMVHLGRGTSVKANHVVLAIGHRPPTDPLKNLWTGSRERFITDPWRPFAVTAIPPDDSVAILGSGLTAIDAVLSLHQLPRTGRITMISRSGLQPQSHATSPVPAEDMTAFVSDLVARNPGLRAVTLCREVHRLAKQHIRTGGNWRAIVDGLRPHTARLWQCLNATERRRFINRIRPVWEVHRHRMAPAIAERLTQLKQAESVVSLTGQMLGAASSPEGVALTLRLRGKELPQTHRFDWVINCTGPAPSNSAEANPVIGSLLVHDWVRRDELSLGLDSTPEGRTISASGEAVPDLFVVGTLRKPLLWESTAVPELRQQAALVSQQILQMMPEDSSCL